MAERGAGTQEWQELYGNWVLVPRRPRAIVHFLGGAFVAAAPQVTYRAMLEFLVQQGFAVVATPFVNTFDHAAIAQRVMRNSNLALNYLEDEVIRRDLPIYGIGHSMGCKLHVLIGSLFPQPRAGNILISFNNYPAKRSIPGLEQVSIFSQGASQWVSQVTSQISSQLSSQIPAQFLPQFVAPDLNVEFTPSPEATNDLIATQYQVAQNLLIKFRSDDIDQTRSLYEALQERFPHSTLVERLAGNHLTPLGQDVNWKPTEFSPLDAIGQFVRQEVYRDQNQLKQTVAGWLETMQKQSR
ncbi:MAG: DUF1350 family protein [Oculatellaceae cyanobacterium Prado106]|jgi:hypothetical protein|nr:DUF1350 family protein [Oculatellaceae cyanobacterium Prado106]